MDESWNQDLEAHGTDVMGVIPGRPSLRPPARHVSWPGRYPERAPEPVPAPVVYIRDRWTAYARDLALIVLLLTLSAAVATVFVLEGRLGWWG
jgi:hypothetical protein